MNASLPVVVIGAGPIGLAAASHLLHRGFQPLVLERGSDVGQAMQSWAHVRMFSPWEFNAAHRLRTGALGRRRHRRRLGRCAQGGVDPARDRRVHHAVR
ncbi:MAG TPA: FAD-dependent oxidoreductase [Xanthomonadaceae bacterium]|jgi:NADPH-dependent 2,4-dienoyl-CoA reductase/sulfur reductase-like enzyme|nr:FAD-dependent oxidoreductase [Xanthomonadaceae bacterium]